MKAVDANQLKYPIVIRTTGDWWYSDFAFSIAIANKGIYSDRVSKDPRCLHSH
jgi:hypothetical protein